jgi:sulfite reductase (ferredoxin)
MNSCGQHGIANIGFQGSSLKAGVNVLPALQILLGGGTQGNGNGRVSEKIIKIPSKKGPQALRTLLDDFEINSLDEEYFNNYYDRKGKDYFYRLLKPLAGLSNLSTDDFVDWGHEVKYESAIGVGECADVVIDLVATLLFESEEKLAWAKESFAQNQFADSIYHSYSVFVSTAKALLLDKQVSCNAQNAIINDFDKHYVADGPFKFSPDFRTYVLRINQFEPAKEFAEKYLNDVDQFFNQSKSFREKQLEISNKDISTTKIIYSSK